MALDFFAGSIAGIAGVIVGHPFDTVKVRLQTQPSTTYSGMLQTFSKIIKEESVRGLYKGLLPPLVGFAAMNSIVFGVQGNTYRRLEPGRVNLFLSGVCGGLAQSIVICPMELVKTQLQLQGQGAVYQRASRRSGKQIMKYSGPLDCIQQIYKTGGVKLCFRGMVPTLWREGPAVGVYITLYHELCAWFAKSHESVHQLGVLHLLLAGGITGSVSWFITYPVDVVKSRIQAHINGPHSGMLDCFRKTYNSEGYPVFFRGLSTAIVRAFPVNAATLATVTLILRFGNQEIPARFGRWKDE